MKIDFSNFYDLISPAFWKAFENKSRVKIYMGGAGSGKSYTAFLEMIYNVVVESCNYLVVRQTANSNRTSTYALTKRLISELNLTSIFKENKSEMTFSCTINGAMIYFRGLEDVERLKSLSYSGASGILERVIFEESSEGSFESFRQLNVRLRGKSKNFFQIVLLLNPVSSTNWVKQFFYDRNDFKAYKHHSTYKDNIFLDDEYIQALESFKDVDINFFNIYALGQWGVTTGLVFNNWQDGEFPFDRETIDNTQILAGCDWGFNHPTCLTLSYAKDNVLYTFDELVAYETTNPDYIKLVEEFNFVPKTQRVVCDDEDPARITEFVNNGYSFVKAKKGKGSVLRTIDYIKSFDKWVIDRKRCPRLMQELEQYHWKLDKDGKPLDEPVALIDDAISAVRYSIEHLALMKGKPGVLSGSISDQKKGLIEIKKAERKKRKEVIVAQRRKKRDDIEKIREK